MRRENFPMNLDEVELEHPLLYFIGPEDENAPISFFLLPVD